MKPTDNSKHQVADLIKERDDLRREIEALKEEVEVRKADARHQWERVQWYIKERDRVLHSDSYKLGRAVTYIPRKINSYKYTSRPSSVLYYLARPSKKKVVAGNSLSYGELYKSPKQKKFTIGNKIQKSIKIATIMDDFTFTSFKYECDLKQLTPDAWKAEIENYMPDLLLIESAWRGKDNKWQGIVWSKVERVKELVEFCREMGIPTAFWNKEDPAHTVTFLKTASLFDFIFTTDSESIPFYQQTLGHSRVFLLPFAAQPQINNPIEVYDRLDKFNFAGSYYAEYKDRCRDFESITDAVIQLKDLDIYDRNQGRDMGPKYEFPDKYQQYIRGSLPYSQIDKAYKGYMYAITMNTIKYSPTMFARRAYELMASNTITVSNYSVGVKNILGDLVVCSDDRKEIRKEFKQIIKSQEWERKYRLNGLRNVLTEHTYEERLTRLLSKVFVDYSPVSPTKTVAVLAWVEKDSDVQMILKSFSRQAYVDKKLYLVSDHPIESTEAGSEYTNIVLNEKTSDKGISDILKNVECVTIFSPNNYYGPGYLIDLALARKYSDARVIGKAAYYKVDKSGELSLVNIEGAYKKNVGIRVDRAIITLSVLKGVTVSSFASFAQSKRLYRSGTQAIDEFNFSEGGVGITKNQRVIDSLKDVENQGKSITQIYQEADAISQKSIAGIKIARKLRVRRTQIERKKL